MPERPKLILIYDYYYPAYRAGGIIRSLVNLVEILRGAFDVFIICRDSDLNNTRLPKAIEPNKWNTYNEFTKVYYAKSESVNVKFWKSQFDSIQPDFIYINGIFSYKFNILALLAANRHGSATICIAPRGMLQKGALSIKPIKKKLFLTIASWLKLYKQNMWHATDEQEANDIRKNILQHRTIHTIQVITDTPNIHPVDHQKPKSLATIRLTTISLIAEKKNQHLVIKALRRLPEDCPVEYDIYGPVKDKVYWKKCLKLMKDMPPHVRVAYKGVLDHKQVGSVLTEYDFFVLLTKGENFGHAIAEALGAGTPVLASPYTPWNELEERGAGWVVDIRSVDSVCAVLERASRLSDTDYRQMSQCAIRYIQDYLSQNDNTVLYHHMFSL